MKTRKKELTICSNPSCGIEFLKDLSEINRNKKIDRKNYCSRKCSGINNHSHLSEFSGNYEYLKPFIKNRSDEYTGIREHFRRIKKRNHKWATADKFSPAYMSYHLLW